MAINWFDILPPTEARAMVTNERVRSARRMREADMTAYLSAMLGYEVFIYDGEVYKMPREYIDKIRREYDAQGR